MSPMGLELKIKNIAAHVGTGASSTIHVLGKADTPGDEEVGSWSRLFQVYGTFSGTVKFEGSLDGTNYSDWICNITAPGFWTIPFGPYYMRSNCTAYTSGTINVLVQTIVKGF